MATTNEHPPATIALTPRLRIRTRQSADAEDEYVWRCDPELSRYNAMHPLREPFEVFVIAWEHERRFGTPGRETFALDDRAGRHVGSIMYYNVDSSWESVELGITIARPVDRGKGLGAEAVISFLGFLWNQRPFRRVVLHTLAWNAAAQRCFERSGFVAVARVLRGSEWFIRMEARREWWLLWQAEGRFELEPPAASSGGSEGT